MVLSLGSSFLYTGVMSFKFSGNFLFVKASLIHFVSFEKQKSLLFSTLIGIPPAVALSESKLSTDFLTVASETHVKENFLFIQNFCVILRMLGWFEKLSVIFCTLLVALVALPDK